MSVTNTDNDTAGITVTPTAGLTTTESGGTATFTIALTSQPTANVTVGLTSSNTAEGTVSPSSVTFTNANWNTPQTVTVTGVDDHVDGNAAYTIVTAASMSSDTNYNGLNPADVSVTNTDNDTAGITVTPTSGLTTTESGGTATFTVVLNTQPTADVAIAFSSSNTAEGTVSLVSLTFTNANWNTPQTVTVTGVDDYVLDGPVAYTVVTAPAVSADSHYSGVDAADVAVTNTDNDTAASLQADLVVTINDNVTEVHSGQSLSYTVVVTNNGPSASLGATVSIGPSARRPARGRVLHRLVRVARLRAVVPCTSLNLLANGVATFHLAATVNDPAPESVTTTATVTMPAGQSDPVPTNNTAVDTDTLETPRIGVSLKAGTPSVSGPAAFDVPYTIEVSNQGGIPASNLQVTDTLTTAFLPASRRLAWRSRRRRPRRVQSGAATRASVIAVAAVRRDLGVGESCTIR